MTTGRVQQPEYTGLLTGIAGAVGVILLADSISQLVQAAGTIDFGNRNWRVGNLRLLFTQVTPLLLGLMLVGQFVVRSAGGRRLVGRVVLALGALLLALVAIYVLDASALAAAQPSGALSRRTTAQVVLSGGVFGLALLATGVRALREKPAEA